MREPTWKITWLFASIAFITGSLLMWILISVLGAQVCKIDVGPIQLSVPCEEKDEAHQCYGLKITSPSSGASIDDSVNISGYYTDSPPNGSILLIFQSEDGKNFWPQSPVVDNSQAKTWEGDFMIGTGSRAYAAVGIMGENAQKLVDYYIKVGDETGRWPAIENFPDDFVICDRILVVNEP